MIAVERFLNIPNYRHTASHSLRIGCQMPRIRCARPLRSRISDLALRLPPSTVARMYDLPLTGAQKSFLRGCGQTLEPALKLGKSGLTPTFFAELQKLLRARELVKLRFLGLDRHERANLCEQIADEGRCLCIGTVGQTALFYRQHPDPADRTITLP